MSENSELYDIITGTERSDEVYSITNSKAIMLVVADYGDKMLVFTLCVGRPRHSSGILYTVNKEFFKKIKLTEKAKEKLKIIYPYLHMAFDKGTKYHGNVLQIIGGFTTNFNIDKEKLYKYFINNNITTYTIKNEEFDKKYFKHIHDS